MVPFTVAGGIVFAMTGYIAMLMYRDCQATAQLYRNRYAAEKNLLANPPDTHQ